MCTSQDDSSFFVAVVREGSYIEKVSVKFYSD